jgi:energy-coupling factor transporter transmembrane protein EcfT
MNISGNINSGFVDGDTCLHKLKPEVKIITALLLIVVSGLGSGGFLVMVCLLSLLGAIVARLPFNNIFTLIRRMAWFFLAIAIFPVLFTPGFYIDLPEWFPVTISYEGLALGLESIARLINILLISLVLMRTTADWMGGLEKLLGPLSQRLPVVRDLFAVALLSIKFLPMILADTEEHFAGLRNKETQGKWGYSKIRSFVHSILQFIVEIFSVIDRYPTGRGPSTTLPVNSTKPSSTIL